MKCPGNEKPSLYSPSAVAVAHTLTPRPVAKPSPEVGASLVGTRPSRLEARMVQNSAVAQLQRVIWVQ